MVPTSPDPDPATPARCPPGLAHRLAEPALPATTPDPVETLRAAIVANLRSDEPDLSARQLGVFLTAYLSDGPHTVRGLAAALNVSKPAITRALDRLGDLRLAEREVDPLDRRSVLVRRTADGHTHLAAWRRHLAPPAER